MSHPKILVQLDSDPHASVFDAVVAVDAGVDHLFQHQNVRPDDVRGLVHGAMFTRGPKDLHNTAIFVGGVDVARGEELLKAVTDCFFGPMRVSVMLDANGANTTAAAAVIAAGRHLDLKGANSLVLAGTGPVGQRAAQLLARQGSRVRLASRSMARAEMISNLLSEIIPGAEITPVQTANDEETSKALSETQVLIAAGAAGIQLVSEEQIEQTGSLQVAIDLNAVPPLGLAGVGVTDKAVEKGNARCYGAIGVGGTKMKIHSEAIRRLFASNDVVLDAEQVFAIGQELEAH